MAIAFQPGNRFRFPDDEKTYTFGYIRFDCGEPVIQYEDDEGNIRERRSVYLSDLIHA